MPELQNLGVHVIDQLSTRFGDYETTLGYIQSFRVTRKDGSAIDESRYKSLIEEILREEFLYRTRNDPLNALALLADLTLERLKSYSFTATFISSWMNPTAEIRSTSVCWETPAAQKVYTKFFWHDSLQHKISAPWNTVKKSSFPKKRISSRIFSMRSRTSVKMSF